MKKTIMTFTVLLTALVFLLLGVQLFSNDINAEQWQPLGTDHDIAFNKHGAVLKELSESKRKIYLGKDCDMFLSDGVKGTWGYHSKNSELVLMYDGDYEHFTDITIANVYNNHWYEQMPSSINQCALKRSITPVVPYLSLSREIKENIFTTLDNSEFDFGFESINAKKREHGISDAFYYSNYAKKYILVVTYSHPVGDFACHVCSVKLSLFVYTINKEKLELVKSYIDWDEGGDWGVTSDLFKIISLGKGVNALYREFRSAAMGESLRWVTVTSITEDSSDTIFSEKIEEINSEDEWTSKLEIIESGSPLNDISFRRRGIKDKHKYSKEWIYKFNGKKYIAQKVK